MRFRQPQPGLDVAVLLLLHLGLQRGVADVHVRVGQQEDLLFANRLHHHLQRLHLLACRLNLDGLCHRRGHRWYRDLH